MTIKHHPSDATLAAYASGTLDQARGLAVATHLSLCAQCRAAVRKFESVGGAVLEVAHGPGTDRHPEQVADQGGNGPFAEPRVAGEHRGDGLDPRPETGLGGGR